jgi:hypothetical protein
MKGGGFPDMEDPFGVLERGLRRIVDRHQEAVPLADAAAAALTGTGAAAEAGVVARWIRFTGARAAAYLAMRTGDAGAAGVFDDAARRADEFIAYLCGHVDDETAERVRFMHEYSWKRVIAAQRPA